MQIKCKFAGRAVCSLEFRRCPLTKEREKRHSFNDFEINTRWLPLPFLLFISSRRNQAACCCRTKVCLFWCQTERNRWRLKWSPCFSLFWYESKNINRSQFVRAGKRLRNFGLKFGHFDSSRKSFWSFLVDNDSKNCRSCWKSFFDTIKTKFNYSDVAHPNHFQHLCALKGSTQTCWIVMIFRLHLFSWYQIIKFNVFEKRHNLWNWCFTFSSQPIRMLISL